jgi:uncharacterized BrkB/YihY/UPF0761 family membrane protein
MNVPLVIAAGLAALLGLAHSYLGERYILVRLFRRGNLSDLFRRAEFTKRTLRLAWHITTVLALGFAMLLVVLASSDREAVRTTVQIISATFAVSGVLALVLSRARHLSWIVFFTIAGLVWVAQS